MRHFLAACLLGLQSFAADAGAAPVAVEATVLPAELGMPAADARADAVARPAAA